jgi:hypothetical protein
MKAIRIAAIACAVLSCGGAAAKWQPQYANQPPEVQAWYKQQHNARGEWCCDESDGHPYYGDYTINNDGSITLQVNGEAHTIPADLVLQGSNPTGHAVWWYLEIGSTHRDYCFAPGTLS